MVHAKLLPLVLTALVAVVILPSRLRETGMTASASASKTMTKGAMLILPEVDRGPHGRKEIALTFDAGAEADSFPQLLATLERTKVRASFFLTGQWVLRYPKLADMLAGSGHLIGNHSWAHPEYTQLSDAEIIRDLLAADKLLNDRMGRPVKPFFRPPYGDRDARVLRVLGEHGYRSVYWTLDTLDSIEPRKSAEFLVKRVVESSDAQLDGAIILAHVGYPETSEALPVIITKLRDRGFRFVTLREWFGERMPR